MSETRIDRMSNIKSYISNQKNIIQHDDFFLEEDWTLLFALIMVL